MINGKRTPEFISNAGVKQGAHESPGFFLTFINPLLVKLKESGIGLCLQNNIVNVLAYADDLVLLANSELELQKLVNILQEWCSKFRIAVNIEKTNVMVFNSDVEPKIVLDGQILCNVDNYKYLGVWFDKHLRFEKHAKLTASSGNRAFGYLIQKIKTYRDLNHQSYSKLFDNLVLPILLYGNETWNTKNFKCISDVQLVQSTIENSY